MIPVLVHGVSIKKTIPIKPRVKSKVSTYLTSSYNIFILSSFLIVFVAFTLMRLKNFYYFFYSFPSICLFIFLQFFLNCFGGFHPHGGEKSLRIFLRISPILIIFVLVFVL